MISDDELNMLIECPSAFSPALVDMAKELQAYRQAFSEPVGKVYFDSYYGAQVSLDKLNNLADGEVLYRKPIIPKQDI